MSAALEQAYINIKTQIDYDEEDVLRTTPIGCRWEVTRLDEDGAIQVECEKTGALTFRSQVALDREFVPANIPLACPHCEENMLMILHVHESVPNGPGSTMFQGYYAACSGLFSACPDTTGIYTTPEEAVAGAIDNGAMSAWSMAMEINQKPPKPTDTTDSASVYRLESTQEAARVKMMSGESLDPIHLMALAQSMAYELYLKSGFTETEDHDFRGSTHPGERLVWEQACAAVELFRGCDMTDVMDEYDDDVEAGAVG